MNYVIEGDNVYQEDERIKQHVGAVNKIETVRIDANTVTDISCTFDLGLGEYVEVSRITRQEVEPPQPLSLEDRLTKAENSLVQKDAEIMQLRQESADTTLAILDLAEQINPPA